MKEEKNNSKYVWLKHPLWVSLLTMASLLFSAITGGILSMLVFGDINQYWKHIVSASSITIIALFIVYILRRLGNQPWSGLKYM